MNCKTSVSDWQESISALADDKFFGIIRMYLGEIKTPYNKQRLIEQLAGFIKNEENSNNLVNLLDEFDIKVITAICHIYNPTKQNISDFFTGDYTMAELYTELSNLVQRLILFTKMREPLCAIPSVLYQFIQTIERLSIYTIEPP